MNSFQITSPTSGKAFAAGSIVEASGRHAIGPGSFVWALLGDIFGHYYLQNPPVTLKADGSWLASNLHLGHDIIDIIFVKVTGSGNDHFLRKVKSNEWGAFDDLPTGTETLGSVRIEVK